MPKGVVWLDNELDVLGRWIRGELRLNCRVVDRPGTEFTMSGGEGLTADELILRSYRRSVIIIPMVGEARGKGGAQRLVRTVKRCLRDRKSELEKLVETVRADGKP